MQAIYLGQDQSLDDQVTHINGAPGIYGTLKELTSTHPEFCWTAWSCCDAIATYSTNISSIDMYSPILGPYVPVTTALVGGRPSRPIAK